MSRSPSDVLEVNRAFYEAFARGDTEQVVALLAAEDLAVVHPGWPPVRGAETVRSTWAQLCAQPPDIEVMDAVAHVLGADVAVVTCLERIGHAVLAATNVWVRTHDGWRLQHHHASPTSSRSERPPTPGEVVH